MIKKFRSKPTIFAKKNLQIQIPLTAWPCGCSQEPERDFDDVENNDEHVTLEGVWAPERDISNHDELMTLTDEPLFLTGKTAWQEKELKANTRELAICKHFKKKITPEYLCYFVQELLTKKERYIQETYQMPVTFYMWYSVYGDRFFGYSFLCYSFLSGNVKKLPFGEKGLILKNQPHVDTFMRKFLKLKRDRNPYIISRIINTKMQENKSTELSEDDLLKRYKEFIQRVGNSKIRMLPK